MTATATAGVSLKPSDAQAGGGFLDDVDVLMKRVYFRLWDYNGSIPTPVLGLAVLYAMLDGSGETEQVYSAGDTKYLVPSPDGKQAVPVSGERTGLMDGTNALEFLMSLINSGFPEHLVGQDVSVFEGTVCHVARVPQKKRAGLKNTDPTKKNDIVVVTKIHGLPGSAEAAAAIKAAGAGTGTVAGAPVVGKVATPKAAAPKATAPAAAAQAPVADGAVQERAISVVMEVLANKGGSVAKASIAGEVFKILNAANDPLRNPVSQLVFKDEFLANGPWSFDGTTISLG